MKLTNAAIMYPDGDIVIGRRHFEIIRSQAGKEIMTSIGCIQGFIDDQRNFYNRSEAKEIALKAGQIDKTHKGDLYSEDLWEEPLELY